jgi:hypothetical protein
MNGLLDGWNIQCPTGNFQDSRIKDKAEEQPLRA